MILGVTVAAEIEVFICEHGLKKAHTVEKLVKCKEFMDRAKLLLDAKELNILTIIFWGHGNRIDNKNGYLKIFSDAHCFKHLFINDLLESLRKLTETYHQRIQFLMTQCYAHCHDIDLHADSQKLTVDWFTSEVKPETSARRWDLLKTKREMSQDEFNLFTSTLTNYEQLELATKLKYKNKTRLAMFLKYLNYASIHIEATTYIFCQRMSGGETSV